MKTNPMPNYPKGQLQPLRTILKTDVDRDFCKQCAAGRFLETKGCMAMGGEWCPNPEAGR